MTVIGAYHIRERRTAQKSHRYHSASERVTSAWKDPIFHVLSVEARRRTISILDPMFAALSPEDQDEVLTEMARRYEPVEEEYNKIRSALWIPHRSELHLEDYVSRSVPFGLLLSCVMALFVLYYPRTLIKLPRISVRHFGYWAIVALAIGTLLYPPWIIEDRSRTDGVLLRQTHTYNWLFLPPQPARRMNLAPSVRIDLTRLVLGMLIVAGVGLALQSRCSPSYRATISTSE